MTVPASDRSGAAVLLGLCLALALTLETVQVLTASREPVPCKLGARGDELRERYWPEIPLGETLDPLADWTGVAALLARTRLDPTLAPAMRRYRNRARTAAEGALQAYDSLLEPLTPRQRDRVLEPQKLVVDHHALGYDSDTADLYLLLLHRLDSLAGQAPPSPAQAPAPPAVRLPLPRLAASLLELADDPREPLTPGQARALLDRLAVLGKEVNALHGSHLMALALLTAGQVEEARSLPPRRPEMFPPPCTLEQVLRALEPRS